MFAIKFLVCLANIGVLSKRKNMYVVALIFRQTSPRLALRAKCRVRLALLIKLLLCRLSEPCKETPRVFRK